MIIRPGTSPFYDHAANSTHSIDYEGVVVKARYQDWFKRRVKEAIHIKCKASDLNKDKGRHQLPSVYDSIISSVYHLTNQQLPVRCSGVTGRGQSAPESAPDTSHWEISADLVPTVKGEERKKGLTLVLPRGGGYHLPDGLSPAAQKRKRKWPRASRASLLHPLRSFWWKKSGGTP